MPMERPTISCDIKKIEQKFAHGYLSRATAFYVSTTNEASESSKFMAEEIDGFGPLWKKENEKFIKYVDSVAPLKFFKNLKFWICEGNHRLLAWMGHISKLYSANPVWHFSIDCILLDTKGRIELVMQVTL